MASIGSIIGGALNLGSSIFGGISASKAMKRAKQNIKDQIKKNQDWYDRRYNEDATQRADAQRILTMTEESIKKRNKGAAGSAAVMGGTDESVAAAKEVNNQALADATSMIAAKAADRKDQIEQQYLSRDAELQNQLQQLELGKADAIAGAVKGATDTGSSIAEMF